LQEASVGDVVGEGVLERVLEVGEEARFIQELSGLEVGETPAKLLLRQPGNPVKEAERNILSDDGGRL
jgi:hypothetical protein